MPWQHQLITKFGGPEVLQMVQEATMPDPGPMVADLCVAGGYGQYALAPPKASQI
jgi:hypothetical protein